MRLLDEAVSQFAVVGDREAVGLVAQCLEHPQRRVVAVEHNRFTAPGQKDLLVALGQSDHRQRGASDFDQRVDRAGELPLAAVDHDQVGERPLLLQQPPEVADQHFVHHREIVALVDGSDPEPPVVLPVGPPPFEGDQTGDGQFAEDVRDVESDDPVGGLCKPERFPERFDRGGAGRRPGQFGAFERAVAASEHGFEVGQHIPEVGGLFKVLGGGGGDHFFSDEPGHFADVAAKHRDRLLDPPPVLLRSDRPDAGGAAVPDDPFEAAFAGLLGRCGVAAGAQSEVREQKLQGHFEGAALGERSEILGSVVLFDPGELQGRERLIPVDLEQEVTLVVAHEDIVVGGEVLDQPGFQDQRLVFGADHLVGPLRDRVDQRAEFRVGALHPGGLEIGAHPAAEIGGLADINHLPEPVPVDVDTGLCRDLRRMKFTLQHRLPLSGAYYTAGIGILQRGTTTTPSPRRRG